VKWAPEPVPLSAIIFLVIISVRGSQWSDRHASFITVGMMLLQVVKLILPYLAATFVYPDEIPRSGNIDLYEHYDRTRKFTFPSLIAGLLLFWIFDLLHSIMQKSSLDLLAWVLDGPWVFVPLYLVLIFIRKRWVNIVLLGGGLILYAWAIIPLPIRE
jgi:hypothetical protein